MIYINFGNDLIRNKIASFDLDYTIIKTKSKKIFPINKNDWMWLYPNIPNKLEQLWKDGFSIVFISNQLGLTTGKVKQEDFEFKINRIANQLNFPLIFLAAPHDDNYRKPRIGLWKYLNDINKVKINKKKSFYVGDMAGRIKINGKKADKYDSDRKFAKNIKIKFYTPEEYFLNDKERPWTYKGYMLDYITKSEPLKFKPLKKTMLMIAGYPGSGKSTFAKKHNKFKHFCKDIYGSKTVKKLDEYMINNNPVLVEGLFYLNSQRKPYLNLAKKYGYKIKYIELLTSKDLSYHLNIYRSLKYKEKKIPMVVYHTYNKRYEKPNYEFGYVTKYHPNISKKINKLFLY